MGLDRGGILASSKAKEATIEIKVIRANGQVEDLGVVSYWHRNPLRRLLWNIFGLGGKIR